MTDYTYDPINWFVSAPRQIEAWVTAKLQEIDALTDNVKVEMSFPDTSQWKKATPLDKVLVHFELDRTEDPILGFGIPGVGTYDEDEETWQLDEASMHDLNFDVGVWVSAEMGGASKRREAMQALKNLFGPAGSRLLFNADTGMNIVSFAGGRDIIDRINDVPVWRGFDMTLVVRVFGRHPGEPIQVPLDIEQNFNLGS